MIDQNHAITIARLLRGEPADALNVGALPDDLRVVAQEVVNADGQDRIAALQTAIAGRADAHDLLTAILAVDPDAQPVPCAQPVNASDIPPLPDDAQPDAVLGNGAGAWIGEYVRNSKAISPMTPALFHESAALFIGGLVIARRLKLSMCFGDVYPNLWLSWIASTTLWGKTTALNHARSVIRRSVPHLLLPQEMTPEAMLAELAGSEPTNMDKMTTTDLEMWNAERNFAGQRGIILDEMSGVMSAAGRDYMTGVLEAMMRAYDCEQHYTRSTRSQGRIVIRNAYHSMLGASTPAAMASHLNAERLHATGWWARFGLLTPDSDRPDWLTPAEVVESPALLETLTRLYERLPEAVYPNPGQCLSAILEDGVYAAWERYNKATRFDLLTPELDQRLWGLYGRLPTLVLKVSIVLAALDWTTTSDAVPTIDMPHLARAVSIVETWRSSAHRVISNATRSDFDNLRDRIIRVVGRSEPDGVTLRNLCRAISNRQPADVRDAVQQLTEIGELEVVKTGTTGRGGRPTERYRTAR